MLLKLGDILSTDRDSGLKTIRAIKEDILARQQRTEREVVEKLRRFQIDKEELIVRLKRLLSKGESIRINDFRVMLRSIKAQQRQTQREVNKIVEEFAMVRGQFSDQWSRLDRASQRRA